jgi:predicted NBD/HSP70 family sugar kinase
VARVEVANGPHVLRSINRTAVLDALRSSPDARTVSEVVERAGLSRPAVTRALSDLTDQGLVTRDDDTAVDRSVGRPAQRFRFRAELGFVAGVDIGPRRVHLVLADLLGRPVHRVTRRTSPSAPSVVRAAAKAIGQGAQDAGLDVEDLWAIGVGSTGIVDSERGVVLAAPSITGWAGLPVAEILADQYHCPVLVENDANLAALAEGSQGAARDRSTYAYVNWADRVGAGLVLDGRLYRGAHSAAGELGFVDPFGEPDRIPAGPRNAAIEGSGSFERLVGVEAILGLAFQAADEAARAGGRAGARAGGRVGARAAKADADAKAGAEELRTALLDVGHEDALAVLCARAHDGDPIASSVWDRVLTRFAAGLVNFLMIADPSLVVVGGPVAAACETLADDLERVLAHALFSLPTIRRSELGTEAVALGAVLRALGVVESRLKDGVGSVPPASAAR